MICTPDFIRIVIICNNMKFQSFHFHPFSHRYFSNQILKWNYVHHCSRVLSDTTYASWIYVLQVFNKDPNKSSTALKYVSSRSPFHQCCCDRLSVRSDIRKKTWQKSTRRWEIRKEKRQQKRQQMSPESKYQAEIAEEELVYLQFVTIHWHLMTTKNTSSPGCLMTPWPGRIGQRAAATLGESALGRSFTECVCSHSRWVLTDS